MAENDVIPGGSIPTRGGATRTACLVLALGLFAVSQLASLGHPLLWQDEGETAMFGQRVLEYGYPKVHADGNRVFGMGVPLALAVDRESDAYTGSFWGQYYLAAAGVWLAEGIEDLHWRTVGVRLPFVSLGLLGLVLFFSVLKGSFGSRSGSEWGIAYALLLALSTSLVLHLREARYYSGSLALVALIVWLQFRRPLIRSERPLLDGLALLFSLFLLFNFFYPAAVAVAIWLMVEALVDLKRGGLQRAGIWRELAPLLVTLTAFGVFALGLAAAFGMPALSSNFSERWDFGLQTYAMNLVHLLNFLLRYEFLLVVVALEILLLSLRSRGGEGGRASELLRTRAIFLRLIGIYALVGAWNPVFFERYFIPIGPLLILILLLDCAALRRMGVTFSNRPRDSVLQRVASAMLVLALGGTMAIRAGEWSGHVSEIRRPVVGPVDAAIHYIRAEYPSPEDLTIATNYEAEVYMYYLGSRVVGRFHAGTPEEDAAESSLYPDIVIPRLSQPRRLVELRGYLHRDEFERYELDVADVAYNNIPELFAGPLLTTTHRFETPKAGEAGPPIAIYRRLAAAREP